MSNFLFFDRLEKIFMVYYTFLVFSEEIMFLKIGSSMLNFLEKIVRL